MSEDNAPLTVTLKAGGGYDVPWIVVRGDNPADVNAKLVGLDETIALTIDAANRFKAAAAVAPIAAGGSVAQATVPQQQAPQIPASAPGWAQPAQAAAPVAPPQQPAVRFHPEGILCSSCNAGVIFKEITAKTGKKFQLWSCPNQRSKGDGHYSEFAN